MDIEEDYLKIYSSNRRYHMQIQEDILNSLKTQLVETISNNDVMVLKTSEYQQERVPFMVIVGIDGYEIFSNAHVGLKDYRITLKIIVDFFIEDDKEGYIFKQTCNQIQNFMQENYLLTRMNLTNIHESIVGCFLDDVKHFVTDESNRTEIYYQLISSSD